MHRSTIHSVHAPGRINQYPFKCSIVHINPRSSVHAPDTSRLRYFTTCRNDPGIDDSTILEMTKWGGAGYPPGPRAGMVMGKRLPHGDLQSESHVFSREDSSKVSRMIRGVEFPQSESHDTEERDPLKRIAWREKGISQFLEFRQLSNHVTWSAYPVYTISLDGYRTPRLHWEYAPKTR